MKMHSLLSGISIMLIALTSNSASAQEVGNQQKGKALFVGEVRFANRGPACNSCHNVDMKGFISGGGLAKDLTQAVTRLTPDGVKGIISGLPFPAMQQSYQGKPITEQEVSDLVAFLKTADTAAATSTPTSPVNRDMMTGGISGTILLLVLFSIFWIRRKKGPVNYSIFKRQTTSA